MRFQICINLNKKYGKQLSLQVNKHHNISKEQEQAQVELLKALTATDPRQALTSLKESGQLALLIPEMEKAYDMCQQTRHHDGTVWEHTLRVVEKVPNKPLLRLTALLHDIGKVETKTIDENGVGHFYKHEQVGADMAGEIMWRLGFSHADIDYAQTLIEEHMRLKCFADFKFTNKRLRKLKWDVGDELLDDLLELCHADSCSCAPASQCPDLVPQLREALAVFQDEPSKLVLPVNGNDIMQIFGIEPGPKVKEYLTMVEDMVLENPEIGSSEIFNFLQKHKNDGTHGS